MAKGDQVSIISLILAKLKEWINCSTSSDSRVASSFTPLRLTVRGSAGSGKSFFIKCLVNVITNMFEGERVVEVAGPTGASAYNVGGETLHRKWRINPHKPNEELGKKAAETLKRTMKRTLVIVIDERSMLTCNLLGAAERNSAATCHGGSRDDEDWGGIPIVVIVGDDYQLPPPTNKEKGAFDLMDSKTSISQQKYGVASSGAAVMESLSNQCMELTSVKRQNDDQSEFKDVLSRLRTGDTLPQDADFLLKRHLSSFSRDAINNITKNGVTMYLFATKPPRNDHNFRKLAEVSSPTNPVALLRTQWTSTSKSKTSTARDAHFTSPPPAATVICRGAMVRLVDKNFEPAWGLYNNTVGVVKDTVFAPGKDPNNGDLPLYVAVQFENYCGPTWDKHNPKLVPVPMVTVSCTKRCCTATFCPLDLSFGMTLHTFQGQSAGPVGPGQPKNAVDRVIVEPGNSRFEGNNPGTLYMAASRATTAGTGDLLNSALYFSGPNMNRYRILDLKHQKSNTKGGPQKLYKKVALREKWVQRLNKHTIRTPLCNEQMEDIISWSRRHKMTKEQLDKALIQKNWRESSMKHVNY